MMLDALSNPIPADVTSKNGGRPGRGGDEPSGFSGTLSKLEKDGSAGNQARNGSDSQAGSVADDAEADVGRDHRTRPSSFLLRDNRLDGAITASKRMSIAQALSAGKEIAATPLGDKNLRNTKVQLPTEEMQEAGADSEATDTTSADGAEATGKELAASDLLSLLANPSQMSAATATGRPTGSVEGRKADGLQGRARDASAAEAMRSKSETSDMVEMPTTELDVEQQQRLFRFVGGKDGSLNSELAQAANGRDRNAEGKTSAAPLENVTILDSRRYLGLAPNSNSATLVASMVGDSEWSAAMQSSALSSEPANSTSTGSVVHMLKLQMNPHDMGSVTATLRLIGEELHVHLTVETRAAYRQLSEDSSGMLDALKSQGFSVDQLTINISTSSDANTQKGQQDAQSGQQMAGNGERNGGTANREQSNGRFGAELNGDVDAGAELGKGETAATGPVGSGAGQLYL